MLNDPNLSDLYRQAAEEYYDDLMGFDDIDEKTEEDCPEWIQEQLDAEIPF